MNKFIMYINTHYNYTDTHYYLYKQIYCMNKFVMYIDTHYTDTRYHLYKQICDRILENLPSTHK